MFREGSADFQGAARVDPVSRLGKIPVERKTSGN